MNSKIITLIIKKGVIKLNITIINSQKLNKSFRNYLGHCKNLPDNINLKLKTARLLNFEELNPKLKDYSNTIEFINDRNAYKSLGMHDFKPIIIKGKEIKINCSENITKNIIDLEYSDDDAEYRTSLSIKDLLS